MLSLLQPTAAARGSSVLLTEPLLVPEMLMGPDTASPPSLPVTSHFSMTNYWLSSHMNLHITLTMTVCTVMITALLSSVFCEMFSVWSSDSDWLSVSMVTTLAVLQLHSVSAPRPSGDSWCPALCQTNVSPSLVPASQHWPLIGPWSRHFRGGLLRRPRPQLPVTQRETAGPLPNTCPGPLPPPPSHNSWFTTCFHLRYCNSVSRCKLWSCRRDYTKGVLTRYIRGTMQLRLRDSDF